MPFRDKLNAAPKKRYEPIIQLDNKLAESYN